MSNLIDKQAAIEAVNQYISQFDAIDANFLDGLKTAINIVMNLPSAQERIDAAYKEGYCDCEQEWLKERRQERKTGKWIGKPIAGYSNVRCSNCSNVYIDNSGKWNYCPNCGADMRKETKE